MDKNYFSFEKLNVWQESRNLVKDIYLLLREFPMEEKYALCDQIRRAVVSVPSNIAEGAGRMSPKEKSHYIEIAFGSLMEVGCQLDIAYELAYITQEELSASEEQVRRVAAMLSGLKRKKLEEKPLIH